MQYKLTKGIIDLRNLTETFSGFFVFPAFDLSKFHETAETFSGDGFVSETVTRLCCYCVLFVVDANFCSSFTVNMRVIQSKSLLL